MRSSSLATVTNEYSSQKQYSRNKKWINREELAHRSVDYPTQIVRVEGKRLSLTEQGDIRYELKTPYRNGTTHMTFEPLDFISKLASLIPAPRINLTRFHGVFAPNSRHRSGIINRETNHELPAETNGSTGSSISLHELLQNHTARVDNLPIKLKLFHQFFTFI